MSTETAPDWEEARQWFNEMNTIDRNNMIVIMYRLCIRIKDKSHTKLTESLNNSWKEKLNDIEMKFTEEKEKFNEEKEELESKLSELATENDIYKQKNTESTSMIMNHLQKLEHKLENEINGLSLKITPSSNGKLGEDYLENILGKMPGCNLTNLTQMKGNGDFLLEVNGKKIMIESKNWTNSSIKGNPKELESFKETAIRSKEESNIDCAIMALHRVTDLKGKVIDMETVYTKTGSLILIYVTNLFNYPDRILYAIDSCLLLLSQQSKNNIDRDKFLYQISYFMKIIENVEDSIKERTKHVKNSTDLIKKDSEQLSYLREILNNIVSVDEVDIPIKDRIVNFCRELIAVHGESSVDKKMLETMCLNNKIAARHVRDAGGIKEIKKLALIQTTTSPKVPKEDTESDSNEDE